MSTVVLGDRDAWIVRLIWRVRGASVECKLWVFGGLVEVYME